MREIKFKFLMENGEITSPYYLKELIDSDSYINIECEYSSKIKQELQYTGLKDKNGVEIYESDIVNIRGGAFYQGYWEINETFEVFYDKTGFFLSNKNYKESFWIAEEIDILGNIYENQELLKEGH